MPRAQWAPPIWPNGKLSPDFLLAPAGGQYTVVIHPGAAAEAHVYADI